ncbi:YlaH-like family protein [Cytobacillus sp. FJAT-54145]|uniref:YlaH-like family protein n=1 Tax=Cytobacillus spartinae TaxID=3299023 RepID=A0ABW6KHL6_9BACI
MEELNGFTPSLRFFIELTDVQIGVWLQFISIIILTIIVYRLGFAKKLPILKNIVVYTCLIIGCIILLVFSYRFPILEGLAIAALILIIYKVRLKQERKNKDLEVKE